MVSTVKVTGIIGAGRGTGVTHFSIRAANYFCSWKQRKTAVIQWNSHKDTERMRNFLEASGKERTFPGPGGGFLLSGRTGGTGCVYGKKISGDPH